MKLREIVVTERCNAFGKVKPHQLLLQSDGTIRVYDDVAGYYTTCHRLTTRTQRRIFRKNVAVAS